MAKTYQNLYPQILAFKNPYSDHLPGLCYNARIENLCHLKFSRRWNEVSDE